MNRKAVLGWCLYDWANSAFPTLISTFVFAVYFTKGIAATPEEGTALWGQGITLAAVLIAVLGPAFGAIADNGGRRKPWLAALTFLLAVSSAMLWFATPEPGSVPWALFWVVTATVAFELSMVFYNAMLPTLTTPDRMGRVSGWAWALGYGGGLAALLVSLALFVLPETPAFGLDKENAEHIRIIPVLVAVWIVVFAWPVFTWTDRETGPKAPLAAAIKGGLATLYRTLLRLREYKRIALFLLARMFYIDGLNTLFSFGGIFAANAFGMGEEEVLFFAIALNISAGLGAFGFAFLDDYWGPKRVILIAVGAISVFGIAMLLVESKPVFWALGIGIGLFLGPAQAASRTMMAHLTPLDLRAEFFGLYAMAGKATAFLGPWAYAFAVANWDGPMLDPQRAGMATVLPFLFIGLVLLCFVRGGRRGETPDTRP